MGAPFDRRSQRGGQSAGTRAVWQGLFCVARSAKQNGVPRSMKMGTTASLWRYDEVLSTSIAPPRLRSSIHKQSPHDFGVAFDGQQESASRRIRGASTLLPVAQSRERQMKGFGKFHLRHVETLPQHLDARHAAHLCKLRRRERPNIGIRPGGSLYLLVSHRIEAPPVGFAARQGLTTFHVHPRSTGLAHVVWPFGPK